MKIHRSYWLPDAINAFNEYLFIAKEAWNELCFILSSMLPVQYNSKDHTAFGILFKHHWVEDHGVRPIDYEHADAYLDLSYEDSVAIADWLASMFSDGYEPSQTMKLLHAFITP